MRTIFCTYQNFCKRNETSKIPSTSFGGCKNFVRRENPLFLDIHPSLGHQILQHMDYEANVTVWLPACGLSRSISKSWKESLLFRIFLQNNISGKWCWRCRWISKGEERVKATVKAASSRLNRPFYSCRLSDLASEWQWGWSWPCFDTDLTAFIVQIKLFLC